MHHPSRPDFRLETERRAHRLLALSSLACVLIFLATIPLPRVDKHLIGSDGMYYYAMTRSILLDRDIDLTNDYALLGVNLGTTPTGMPACPFALGTSILWMPFFLLAHALSLLLNILGLSVPTNGIGYVYDTSVCLGSIGYACAGFAMAYVTTRRLIPEGDIPISWGVIAMWWSTPAIYYMIAEPSMSHAMSIFSVSLFFYVWARGLGNRSSWDWLKLGLAAGLVGLVRWQNGIIALVAVAEICWGALKGRVRIARGLYQLLILGASIVLVVFPQMIVWKILYGKFVTIPQGAGFTRWGDPRILATLFSTQHGLITWHPVFLLALLGLVPLWRMNRPAFLLVAFMFLGELYVNSSVWRWWADNSFGHRRFVCLVPLLILPLVLFLRKLDRKWAAAILMALILWNGLSLAQFRAGFVSPSKALSVREMTVDRLLVPLKLLRKVLH